MKTVKAILSLVTGRKKKEGCNLPGADPEVSRNQVVSEVPLTGPNGLRYCPNGFVWAK